MKHSLMNYQLSRYLNEINSAKIMYCRGSTQILTFIFILKTLHGWSLMMVSKRQVRILKMQESSETYSDEPIAGVSSF